MNHDACAPPAGYFSHARTEIEALLPQHVGRVLEVGCGSGGTLAWLKRERACDMVIGIERELEAAGAARAHADHIECGDAETCLPRVAAYAPFDLVLCLDVLEHLVDPWHFLRQVEPLVRPGGSLIVSVPNVRHYKVSLPLLFLGRWRYQAAGVLDRTHLRFFTRESARQLVNGRGFEGVHIRGTRPPVGSASWFAHALSLGLMGDLFSVQFMLASTRRAE